MTENNALTVREFTERLHESQVDINYFDRTPAYGHTEPRTLEGGDRVGWADVKPRQYSGMFGSTFIVDAEDSERWQALLMLPSTGRGDYNNSATYWRSNMRVLDQNYPDTFVTVGFSSRDGQQLALPMDATITEDLAEVLEKLWGDYPILDESDQSELEQEILEEDWDSWLESDFHSELETAVAEVLTLDKYEIDLEEYVDNLLSERGTDLREVFWRAMDDTNTYPEFETSESCYIRDLPDVAKSAALKLTREAGE